MEDCFRVTKSFEPTCRQVCTEQEYNQLRRAFFEKAKNLSELKDATRAALKPEGDGSDSH